MDSLLNTLKWVHLYDRSALSKSLLMKRNFVRVSLELPSEALCKFTNNQLLKVFSTLNNCHTNVVALIWMDYPATAIHLYVWKKHLPQLLRRKTVPCSLWKVTWLMSRKQNSWNHESYRTSHCRAQRTYPLDAPDSSEDGRFGRYPWIMRGWRRSRHLLGNEFNWVEIRWPKGQESGNQPCCQWTETCFQASVWQEGVVLHWKVDRCHI